MEGSSHGGVRRSEIEETAVLPLELIYEILLRLPVKSLVQFKTVCKSWLSLISDPHFAKSHFDLDAARTEKIAFLAPLVRQFLSIDFNVSLHDNSSLGTLNLSIMTPTSYFLVIVGSCRGFLLLICAEGITVWNPCTCVYKFIDWSPFVLADSEFTVTTFLRGFGYDPSTDDYLVVLGSFDRSIRPEDRVTHVEYFSVRSNAWKEIEMTHVSYKQYSTYNDNQMGCLFSDAIHWLAFRFDVSVNVMVAFDLRERSFSEMPLPVGLVHGNFKLCILRALGDFLNLCAVGLDHSVEIWVMKEYNVQSSWTKTIVVSAENIPTGRYFFPICYTRSDDIVGADIGTGLVKCNDRGQLQEHRTYFNQFNCHCGYVVAKYTESLLSLPQPLVITTKLAEEDDLR